MQFSLSEVARITDGELHGDDRMVDGLAIDSRLISHGELFVAVKGERDGHDFVAAAAEAGAGGVLVERIEEGSDNVSAVVVADVTTALEDLARSARENLGDVVVGITGSLGKTTTKDLLASVLARRYPTTASEKSFNNELGVPLTLINAPHGTRATVVEMGARGVGHIAYLCSMASPSIGVITTVEAVHTETMGGIESIADIKGELVDSLPSTGLAVLNADVPVVAALRERSAAPVVTFGERGDVQARNISLDAELVPAFTITSPWGEVSVRLGVRGEHNVMNALAAATVGLHLGLSADEVADGLANPQASPMRMDLMRLATGATLINDCYNASPASTTAALRALASLGEPGAGRRVAVLGVMAELGDRSAEGHRRVAATASDLGIEIVAVGTDLYGVAPVEDTAAAIDVVVGLDLSVGDALLVKGSRVAGLERIVDALSPANS